MEEGVKKGKKRVVRGWKGEREKRVEVKERSKRG